MLIKTVVGERLLTVAQAAEVLHLSVAGTYGLIRAGGRRAAGV